MLAVGFATADELAVDIREATELTALDLLGVSSRSGR